MELDLRYPDEPVRGGCIIARGQRLYPSIGQSIFLAALVIIFQIGIGAVLGLIIQAAGLPVTLIERNIVQSGISLLAFGLVLLIGRKRTGAPVRRVFPLTHVRPMLYIPMTLTALGSFILVSDMVALMEVIFPMPDWLAEIFTSLVVEQSLASAIVVLMIVPPLTEEALFRGLILRGLRSRHGDGWAVAIQALIFGIFHVIPWQIAGAIPPGLIFGWWAVGTGSLIPSIYGHALWNGAALVLGRTLTAEVLLPGWLTLAAFPVTMLGVRWLMISFRKPAQAR